MVSCSFLALSVGEQFRWNSEREDKIDRHIDILQNNILELLSFATAIGDEVGNMTYPA